MNLPPFDIFPTIEGERVSLRQISVNDIESIVEISFYDATQATSIQQAADMQIKINDDYLAGNSIHWAIIDLATNKIVGTCGYYRELSNGQGELGCVLLPQFRGNGFMTAAMLLAIRFGLDTIGLKQIWAATNRNNLKAIKLLEHLNFLKKADVGCEEVKYELDRSAYC